MWHRALFVAAVVYGLGGLHAGAQDVDLSRLQIVEGQAGVSKDTGFIHIAGEIHNRSSEWVMKPRLTVELLDASGDPIRVDSILAGVAEDAGWEPHEFTHTTRTYIPPGEVGVFYYIRDGKQLRGRRYASHRLAVATARKAINPPQVVIEELRTPMEDDVYIVSGRIHNRGQVGCYSPQVIVGVYGPDGRILRVADETPEETHQKVLAGGQSVPFKLKIYPDTGLGGTIGSLKAWADCVEPY
jgi:hypothetical protein